ncbi:TIGR01777 family oxidoreductase [Sutcliffiella rhizosphaerae]|uniref:Epimerase family protein n=1 Tax=Sutcliffiella rhizosphaerae TaxID=2880967 RepID=A0ABM8YL50_9BACI|nr:TIGR01777 family oxidoreductase [Sutcliffiella rhizosphaerae]CAG9620666.1 Epimerase family protein [Sutcliffiella rhizosphaerae]
MKKKKIVLAGGTGFIGRYLEEKYRKENYEVYIISRQPQHISWSDTESIISAVDQSEMVINLAGKSVDCRYNEKNMKEIFDSRTKTTNIIGEAIKAAKNPPALWINSSTATIYRHAEDRPMTEEAGEIGEGFSVEVAKTWEKAFFNFELDQTRQVALRIAIVLGKNGGVMTPFTNLVKYGLGGIQGPGTQMFSWVHIEDVSEIIQFIKKRKDLEGVFNCSAPNPIPNKEFMSSLRKKMNRNVGLPSPKWMLELGAIMIRTETELILKSRWVVPERLLKEGFSFKYSTIEKALEDIVS